MDVPRQTLETIYADIVGSVGYKTTVGPVDKRKVERRLAGERTELPSARLAKAAWRVAAVLTPLVTPPPPPPKLAPQTYNRGASGQDARYCTAGLPNVGGVYTDAGGFKYDASGLSLGGRSGNAVAGLRPSDEMNGQEPCAPYNGFPPWPDDSYKV